MWLNYSAAAFKEPREPSQQEAEVLSCAALAPKRLFMVGTSLFSSMERS